jgi:hypothetical protein
MSGECHSEQPIEITYMMLLSLAGGMHSLNLHACFWICQRLRPHEAESGAGKGSHMQSEQVGNCHSAQGYS